MGQLHLNNALKVATGAYFENGLQMDFMAVASLNDALVEAYEQDRHDISGHPVTELEMALLALTVRNQHSPAFKQLIGQGRDLIVQYMQKDERLLGDIKYWHILSASERISSCQRFAEAMKDIFTAHVGLPPDRPVHVITDGIDAIRSYQWKNGEMVPQIYTARPRPSDPRSQKEWIAVSTSRESTFENGCMTYAAIYGAYIRLIEQNLGNIVREKFAGNLSQLDHDRDLWKHAVQQNGFVDPALHDIHPMQFWTSLVHGEEYAMKKDLQNLVDHSSDHVPERVKLTSRQKLGLFVGSVMGWNP